MRMLSVTRARTTYYVHFNFYFSFVIDHIDSIEKSQYVLYVFTVSLLSFLFIKQFVLFIRIAKGFFFFFLQ